MTERGSTLVKAILTKGANKQKNFVHRLSFPNRVAKHALKLLIEISLRDVHNLC